MRSQLTIEGRTHPARQEAMPTYGLRPRATDTPFELQVTGSNTRRPMPLRVELVVSP